MFRFLYLLLFLFGIFGGSISAQQVSDVVEKSTHHTIGLYLGLHIQRSQDLVFSPLIYRGSSVGALGISYQRESPKSLHRFRLEYDKINVRAAELISFTDFGRSFTRIPAEAMEINIQYGYAHQLAAGEKVRWHLGGLLETRIYFTRYHFGLSEDEGYLLPTAFHPWLMGTWQLTAESRIQLEAWFPLLAWISRPEYAIVDNEEIQDEGSYLAFIYGKGELATWDRYQALQMAGRYERRLGNHLTGAISYRINYARYTEPLNVAVLKHYVDLALSYNF